MAPKVWTLLLAALFLMPTVSAYQQAHLVFSLDSSWKVVEQRHAAQTFEKEGMSLEVRSFTSGVQLLAPRDFAASRGGELVSEAEYGLGVKEAVVTDAERVYVLSHFSSGDEVYTLTLVAPKGLTGQVRLEMQKLYSSLKISPSQKFAEAPWEESLVYPGEEGFSIPLRERIPLGKLALALVVVLVVGGLWRRRKGRKEEKKTGD